jgi:hypothetical protein
MAKFQKLAALKQFEIFNATFKRQVPACATACATRRKFLFYFPARWRSAGKSPPNVSV